MRILEKRSQSIVSLNQIVDAKVGSFSPYSRPNTSLVVASPATPNYLLETEAAASVCA